MTIEATNMIEAIQPNLDFGVMFADTVGVAGAFWALHYTAEYVKPDNLTAVYYAYAGVVIAALFT
jgi:hypothetical protein|tara:strand:+ start:79 stop:273 length:195 start_codon:yes stop_codon:yes gene_type:complete